MLGSYAYLIGYYDCGSNSGYAAWIEKIVRVDLATFSEVTSLNRLVTVLYVIVAFNR